MKFLNYFLFISIFLTILGCDFEKDKGVSSDNLYQTNGLLYYYGENKPFTGKFHGTTGDKKFEGYIRNGKQEGKFVVWFENGRKQVLSHYRNGVLHGKYTEWYSNGEIKTECYYENGTKISQKK